MCYFRLCGNVSRKSYRIEANQTVSPHFSLAAPFDIDIYLNLWANAERIRERVHIQSVIEH